MGTGGSYNPPQTGGSGKETMTVLFLRDGNVDDRWLKAASTHFSDSNAEPHLVPYNGTISSSTYINTTVSDSDIEIYVNGLLAHTENVTLLEHTFNPSVAVVAGDEISVFMKKNVNNVANVLVSMNILEA